jgi:hypothetical protein
MNSTVRDLASKTGVMLRLMAVIGAERKLDYAVACFWFCPTAVIVSGQSAGLRGGKQTFRDAVPGSVC